MPARESPTLLSVKSGALGSWRGAGVGAGRSPQPNLRRRFWKRKTALMIHANLDELALLTVDNDAFLRTFFRPCFLRL